MIENISIKINDLHAKFSEYGMNVKQWLRKCAVMLPDIERYEVWKFKGFSSIYEYAAKLSGMNKSQVQIALRVMKNIEDKPALIKIAEEKGINAVKPVAVISTQETANFWAAKAKEMTKNELELFVREIRNENKEKPSKRKIIMELDENVANKLSKLSGGDMNKLMKEMIRCYEKEMEAGNINGAEEMRSAKIEFEPELRGEPKPEIKENASHYVPSKIKKYINNRSKGRCEFPNCWKKAEVLHHTERFMSVKRHDPDRIVALCKEHHLLAHKGLIYNENNVDISQWKIMKKADLTDLNRYVDDRYKLAKRANSHLSER